jgi:lipopolysaccharide assembly outer membrane protein LptD (OstA)
MRIIPSGTFVVALVVLASTATAQPAQPAVGPPTTHALRTVQIAANELALVGSAEVIRGDTSLYADEIDFFRDENRAVATGNVLLTQGANRIAADSADFDIKANVGIFYHAYGIATIQPPKRPAAAAAPGTFVAPTLTGQENDVYFFGDVIEKIGPKKYKITNGGFTTCLQPTPRWNLNAKTIVVHMNHYTLLEQAVLKVKGVPLLYLPVMYYPTKEDNRATGFLIPTYGSSSLLGQSIHNAFFWAIDRSQDLTIQDELFSKVGQGIGTEYRYNDGPGSTGDIRAFMLMPNANAVATSGIPDENSFDISGSASQTLPAHMRANMSVNYFSSLTTHEIFNVNIYDASANQRQYTGNLVGAWQGYSLNATLNHSEYFYDPTDSTVSGSTPVINLARNERPLFSDSQLYLAVSGQYAHLQNEIKTGADPAADQPAEDNNRGVDRLDFSPQIRYPFKKWQWFTVNSSVMWRDTFYSRSLDPAGLTNPSCAPTLSCQSTDGVVSQSLNRQYTIVQAQITGPVFSRVFDTPGNGYAEKFKHTVEPVFTVSRTTNIPDDLSPGTPTSRIIQNDATDYVTGGTTNVVYGLNNHFYAKRKIGQVSQTFEIFTVSLAQTYYTNSSAPQFDTSYQTSTATTAPSHFSPVKLDVRAQPNTSATGTLHAEFDSRGDTLTELSANGGYNWIKIMQTQVGWTKQYNLDATGLRGPLATNSVNISASAQTSDNRFGGRYTLFYDILNSAAQSQLFSGFYNAQCCGLAVSYSTRPIIGVSGQTSNSTFFVSVTLAGLGSVSPLGGGMSGMPGMTH